MNEKDITNKMNNLLSILRKLLYSNKLIITMKEIEEGCLDDIDKEILKKLKELK